MAETTTPGAAAPEHPASTAAAGSPAAAALDLAAATPEQAVAKVIARASAMGASDVFFAAGPQATTVQVRHLGIVRPLAKLSADVGKRAVAHIKVRASMDVTEKRRPLDGRWIFDAGDGRTVDLRINCLPTLHGEDVAIRLLDRRVGLFPLDALGMTPEQLGDYRAMIHGAGGMVLITGPTGSGKTATLYAALVELADGTRKINTIEDPIEFAVDGLRQSQVNPAIELGFLDLLRSLLRQNPDVIMIGEIRDAETAKTAVHAANSGILVFATLHAPAAPAAVQTMRSLGAHPHFLAAGLRGVVAQRLVRTLCPGCRVAHDLGEASPMFEDVRPWLAPGEGHTLYAPGGCDRCNGTGYAGMAGVYEVLPISRRTRALIADNHPAREIREQAAKEGLLGFRQAALLKVARGQTTAEEVFRVVPSEELLMED